MNLLNELTVFVIDYGDNPNLPDVLESLKNQTCKFKQDIVKNVCPMGAAFQEMLNRCTTKYFIQLDSDMVLNDDAVEKLYYSILESDEKTAMISFMLLDVHLAMPIVGIKIYKHEIFKKYPYDVTHPSVEMNQLERVQKDGYKFESKRPIVAEHSPKWTNELIFTRYYTLMETYKLYKYGWVANLPKKLFIKVQENPNDWNIHALLGICASLFNDEHSLKTRNYSETIKSFSNLKEFLK